MKIYRIAQGFETSNEYLLENGMLYDENADDVFSIRELNDYKVPLLSSPQEANAFLEQLEVKTNRTFGRVPAKDSINDFTFKDTYDERQKANQGERDKLDLRRQRGKF